MILMVEHLHCFYYLVTMFELVKRHARVARAFNTLSRACGRPDLYFHAWEERIKLHNIGRYIPRDGIASG